MTTAQVQAVLDYVLKVVWPERQGVPALPSERRITPAQQQAVLKTIAAIRSSPQSIGVRQVGAATELAFARLFPSWSSEAYDPGMGYLVGGTRLDTALLWVLDDVLTAPDLFLERRKGH